LVPLKPGNLLASERKWDGASLDENPAIVAFEDGSTNTIFLG
jgi:hypothetical protein